MSSIRNIYETYCIYSNFYTHLRDLFNTLIFCHMNIRKPVSVKTEYNWMLCFILIHAFSVMKCKCKTIPKIFLRVLTIPLIKWGHLNPSSTKMQSDNATHGYSIVLENQELVNCNDDI